MARMNISLPEGIKEPHEEQVHERGYGTGSEFIRQLLRRQQQRSQLHTLLVDGMSSGSGSEMNEEYFDRLRDRVWEAGAA